MQSMERTPTHRGRNARAASMRWAAAALLAATLIAFAACGSDDEGENSSPPPIADLTAEGEFLVNRFFAALASGQRAAVAAVLSPAFQIVRATGTVHDRDGYLDNLPTVGEFEITDVRATLNAGVLVVSYVVLVDEVLEGVEQTTRAPRLSTFQWEGGDWLLVSHANFGAVRSM